MTIAVGTQLGPFEILSPLGAGGMGEVYRARDSRLGREVAIKVLPAAFSQDADRLRRFEQEARAAGMLNHPNILTIFEIGTHEGSPYIVSELLAGEELRAQLNGGALPVRRAVDYAQQTACGLQAAHEKGITHRDLKPENLFITTDGRVKILDFGLAKLKRQPVHAGVDSEAPTALPPQTDPGTVMGTVGYMAPEQVNGQDADHRADIFALGVVLYEMLAGRRAFDGASSVAVMSAILRDEPEELQEINDKIPPQLERIVRRCLEKRPGQRFQSAGDLGFALEALSTPSGSRLEAAAAGLPTVAEPAGKAGGLRGLNRERLAWVVAGVLLVGLLASLPFTIAHFRQAPAEVRTTRFSVLPPEKSTLGAVTISPDGRRLAFIARDAAGKDLLWVRPLDALTAQPLAGTDNAMLPFWSPDSRFLGFFAGRKLKKVEVTGGSPSTLYNASRGGGGAWNRDDVIIFAPNNASGLLRVSASGGEAQPVTTLDSSRQEIFHRFPQFLPDGRHFLYFARSAQLENSAICVGVLDQPQARRIISADTNVAYAPPGYLLFLREGTLMAQAFDAASLALTGAPFRVAEHVGRGQSNNAYFSVSDTGVLVYQSGGTAKTQLVWCDRNGKQLGSPGPPGDYFYPALSPDEKRVAIGRDDAQTSTTDIWLLDLQRGIPSRFTFDPARNISPVWSPDGSRIVFASNRDGPMNLYQKLSSGAGSEEALLKSSDGKWPSDWSLDGRFILYEQLSLSTQWDLWVFPLFGERQPFPFLQTKFSEQSGVFAPDARWIAYQSDESGSYQVYVQSFPPSGDKWQISSEGGSRPRFRRDGKELFYLAANGKLMAVEVKTNASSFEFGVPKPLFEAHTTGYYAVTGDGQRFLLNPPIAESTGAPITVVLNWAAEVKRRD